MENHPDAEVFRYSNHVSKKMCVGPWTHHIQFYFSGINVQHISIYITIYNHWCSNTINYVYIYIIYAIIIFMLEIPSTMLLSFRVLKAMGGWQLFPATSMTGWCAGWIDKYSEVHVVNPRMNHPNVGSYVHEIQFNWDKISINVGIFPRNGRCSFFFTWPPCLVHGMALRLTPFELRVICVVAPEQL